MFVAVLFSIAKGWKQPKCPSISEWIKKLWYIYMVEFYTMRKKELLPFATAWMEFISPKGNKPVSERQIPYDLTFKWNLINKTNK